MKMTAREREWNHLMRQERTFLSKGSSRKDSRLNRLLADKVPEKLQETLDTAFAKAFEMIFEKGTGIIEKTYKKDELEHQYQVNAYSADLEENRRSLRQFSRKSSSSGAKNLVISSVEGVGLGALGIGLPDIPLFAAVMLKSIYETALSYGYTYESPEEKYFILKLIETALSCGPALRACDREVNAFIEDPVLPEDYSQSSQISMTAATMSTELLYMKFLQGIPVAGAVGGAYNTIYLQKVLKYARLKYYRRFLTDRDSGGFEPDDAC